MIRELDVTQLANELNSQNIPLDVANIWDVRDEKSYREGHIEGAVNHPINKGISKETLDSTTGTVYVLCGGGNKAPRASQQLEELDSSRDIVVLTGGTRKAKASDMTIVVES